MTKKHFIELADVVNQIESRVEHGELLKAVLIDSLANFCESQNPDFNRERWIGYIGYIKGENGLNGGKI